jgi:RimJ/RimL family protein N-acetyltransferase
VLEPYDPVTWPDVERFARRLSNFHYVKTTIQLHIEEKRPGGCYVWREGRRIAAFCALNYLNPDDAWLYGMRVDPAFHNRGIGTKFTDGLINIAGRDGRTWIGLNTDDRASHRPVFRVAEKLGMKLEGIYCNDVFWSLRRLFSRPRLKRHPDIFSEFLKHGRSTFFHETPGWFWSRTLPARRDWVNQGGFVLCGVPVHIARRAHPKGQRSATVSLLELPEDPNPLFSRLLAYARGRNWIVVDYPVEWKRKVRRAWRELIPSLRQHHHYTSDAERVYGKYL